MSTFGRLALLACLLAPAFAAHAETAEGRRVRVVARALSFDQNLKKRSAEALHILVATQANDCDVVAKEFAQLNGVRVQGLPIEVRKKNLPSADKVIAELKASPTQVVYLCPGFDADVPAIVAQTRKLQILSVGSSRAQVEHGVTLGVDGESDKLTIVVNLAAAKAEGASFSDQLLKIASLIP